MTNVKPEFKDRLEQLIGQKSVTSFGQKCGIGESSLRKYLRGSMPGLDKLIAIANASGVNIEWLATGRGPMRPGETKEDPYVEPEEKSGAAYQTGSEANGIEEQTQIPQWQHPDPEMFHYVPMARAKLSAGGGMFVLSEDISEYYAFRKNWLNKVATSPKNVVLMTVQGHSMAPTIRDKDTVMIDIGRTSIIEGQVYALRLDDTIMLKRLTHRPGGIVNVISDNKEEFETYQAKRSEIHLIGQIVFFCRDLVSGE